MEKKKAATGLFFRCLIKFLKNIKQPTKQTTAKLEFQHIYSLQDFYFKSNTYFTCLNMLIVADILIGWITFFSLGPIYIFPK